MFWLGKNEGERKFALTAPVTQAAVPLKLEMTAPVTQAAAAGRFLVQSMLPKGVTAANLSAWLAPGAFSPSMLGAWRNIAWQVLPRPFHAVLARTGACAADETAMNSPCF